MWESVYPYSLSLGPPLRHHLVIYFRIRLVLILNTFNVLVRIRIREYVHSFL
jgi:hypothetical protein